MRVKQNTVMFILLFFMLIMPYQKVRAEENYQYEVAIDPSPAAIGSEVSLTFRLTDYTDAKSAIRGFQIDITDVDDALQDAVCTTLVTDTENVLTNVAKYQPARDIVRHAYAKMKGAMDYSVADLMEVKFTIPDIYTEAGTLSLPLRILIQNEAGDKLTYNSMIEIHYVPKGDIPDKPVISVDVTWGNMEFDYTDGIWNPQTHRYENASWQDHGTGYVTVSNTGSEDAVAEFTYSTERTDILGRFRIGERQIDGPQVLAVGKSITANLNLTGKPESFLGEDVVIGRVTVTIGQYEVTPHL